MLTSSLIPTVRSADLTWSIDQEVTGALEHDIITEMHHTRSEERSRKSVTSISLVKTLVTTVSNFPLQMKKPNNIPTKHFLGIFSLSSLENTLPLSRKPFIPSDDLAGEGWRPMAADGAAVIFSVDEPTQTSKTQTQTPSTFRI